MACCKQFDTPEEHLADHERYFEENKIEIARQEGEWKRLKEWSRKSGTPVSSRSAHLPLVGFRDHIAQLHRYIRFQNLRKEQTT